VINDFHPYSVFQQIPPFVLRLHNENIDEIAMHSVRLASGVNIIEAKAKVTAIYKEAFPDTLFEFKYYGNEMDDTVSIIYNGIVKTFLFFSLITISIAVVGMFGLVAFTTKARTKEIGIRKVHGASIGQIFGLLAKEFVIVIIIAVILSFPAGIGFRSLDPAAYKAETSIWEYMLTGGLVFLVTFLTITYHTRRASKQNPSESLRYE
jgi:putative ABC transport system permease protein